MTHAYRFADDVVFQEVEGGGVLLSKRNGEYRQVNETGSTVLSHIRGGAATPLILARMAETYPAVSQDQLAADVQTLLDELERVGVILHD